MVHKDLAPPAIRCVSYPSSKYHGGVAKSCLRQRLWDEDGPAVQSQLESRQYIIFLVTDSGIELRKLGVRRRETNLNLEVIRAETLPEFPK